LSSLIPPYLSLCPSSLPCPHPKGCEWWRYSARSHAYKSQLSWNSYALASPESILDQSPLQASGWRRSGGGWELQTSLAIQIFHAESNHLLSPSAAPHAAAAPFPQPCPANSLGLSSPVREDKRGCGRARTGHPRTC